MTLEELKQNSGLALESLAFHCRQNGSGRVKNIAAYITALEAECERLRGELAKFTESHPRPDRVAMRGRPFVQGPKGRTI